MSDGVEWTVLFSHDWVHIFKLWRNKLIDSNCIKYSNEMELLKDDVLQLMQKADSTICKLRDLHVNCKSSDRQNVRLECELVSVTNATLLLELFPVEKRKKSHGICF